MHGYDEDKAKVIARLRRIEGQVRAITQMVEDNTNQRENILPSRFRAARWPMKNLRRLPRPLRVSSNRDEFYRHSPSMTYWVPCLSK